MYMNRLGSSTCNQSLPNHSWPIYKQNLVVKIPILSPITVLYVVAYFPVLVSFDLVWVCFSIWYSFPLYLGILGISRPYSTENHVQLTTLTPILTSHHCQDGLHAERLNAKQAVLTPWHTTSFLAIQFLLLLWRFYE